jgi:hypothetical protein
VAVETEPAKITGAATAGAGVAITGSLQAGFGLQTYILG